MTANEAAERGAEVALNAWAPKDPVGLVAFLQAVRDVRTAERRATVERIRSAITETWVMFGEEWTTEGTEPGTRVPLIRASNLHRILDEEAAR